MALCMATSFFTFLFTCSLAWSLLEEVGGGETLLHIVLPHVQIAFLKFPCFSRVYSNSNSFCSCSFEAGIIG